MAEDVLIEMRVSKAMGEKIPAGKTRVNESVRRGALAQREILRKSEDQITKDILKSVRKIGDLHKKGLKDGKMTYLMRQTIQALGTKSAIMGSISGTQFYNFSRNASVSQSLLERIDPFSPKSIVADEALKAIIDKMESEIMYVVGLMINGDKEWDWDLIEKQVKRSTSGALYESYREMIAENALGDPINWNTNREVVTRRLTSIGACDYCREVSEFAFNTAPYHAGCRCTEVPVFPKMNYDNLV